MAHVIFDRRPVVGSRYRVMDVTNRTAVFATLTKIDRRTESYGKLANGKEVKRVNQYATFERDDGTMFERTWEVIIPNQETYYGNE